MNTFASVPRARSSACLSSARDPRRPAGVRQLHPYVAVDVVLFAIAADRLGALLVKVRHGPFAGAWAFPGGFIGLDESPDTAAHGELAAHLGMHPTHTEQLYTFGGPGRDPGARVVSVAYLALDRHQAPPRQETAKYADARWFPMRRLPRLAYDHARVARVALERLRAKLTYTNIVCGLLPNAFTLGELQRVYEIVLGRRLDRRNFRRKFLALDLLARAPGIRGGAHRPAALFRFRRRAPTVLPMM